MKQLIFATHNANKVREISALIGGGFEMKSLDDIGFFADIPETGATLNDNALIKARTIFSQSAIPCFADDTGLEVDALGGAPGVYSARYAGDECDSDRNIDKLLSALAGQTNRSARFRTVIAFVDKSETLFFEGVVEGRIAERRLGEGGFGYDPIFIPSGFDVSFAQMNLADKNKISHRGRAFHSFVEYLKTKSND